MSTIHDNVGIFRELGVLNERFYVLSKQTGIDGMWIEPRNIWLACTIVHRTDVIIRLLLVAHSLVFAIS